jgi:hypothetical protein
MTELTRLPSQHPFLFVAGGVWLCCIALVVMFACIRFPIGARHYFRRMTMGVSAWVAVSLIWTGYKATTGVVMPGWFYAWLYGGVYAPSLIMVFAGAMAKEAAAQPSAEPRPPSK